MKAIFTCTNNYSDKIAMQYDSFKRFFSKDESRQEFSFQRIFDVNKTIPLERGHAVTLDDWRLDEPQLAPSDCIRFNTTYSRRLWISFSMNGPRVGSESNKFWKWLCDLPAPTPTGEFILSSPKGKRANRYVMIMQLAKAPGVYFHEKKSHNKTRLRICEIRPVLGRPVFLLEKRGGYQVSMSGLKTDLSSFSCLIRDEDALRDRRLLVRLYRFLQWLNLIPEEKVLFSLRDATIEELQFTETLFRDYVLGFDFSRLGKRQMNDQLGETMGLEYTGLSLPEWTHILERFQSGDVTVTDDRSLKNRKVKLIGDFLFENFQTAFSHLKALARENFQKWLADSPIGKNNRDAALRITRPGLGRIVTNGAFDGLANSIRRHELMQLLDDTNPLSEMSQKRRLTFRGPNGVPENSLFLDQRDVHPTDFGRICPVETPQGENLGFNLYLAKDARINSSGLIETRFRNRQTDETCFLDPYDEEERVEGAAIPIESVTPEKYVHVKTGKTEISLCSSENIRYEYASPHGFLGYAASLIPFIQHDDANRALMGSGMMKQALPLLNPEPPYIGSGMESFFTENGTKESPFFREGQLCLGRNLLVGYLPWDLLNCEDGIVISGRLVADDRLTHVETEDRIIDEQWFDHGKHFEEITSENPYLTEEQRETLDEFGVIKKGSLVQAGDVLVSRVRIVREAQNETPEKRNLYLASRLLTATSFRFDAEVVEDASIYVPKSFSGKVTSVHWEYSKTWEDLLWPESAGGPPENASEKACSFPQGVLRRITIALETVYPVQIGDKLTGRHGNKGVVAATLPERDMPYIKESKNHCSDPDCSVKGPHRHLEILINPLTITGRLNLGQLYETTLGWIAAHENRGQLKAMPFSRDWSWAAIVQKLRSLNLTEKQDVFFLEEGKELKMNRPVTVGYQYFLKLKHLAAKKIRARSTFTYGPHMDQPAVPHSGDPWQRKRISAKTAQRSGEMEVWALEGHGARSLLDELLYLKSDDEKLRREILRYARAHEEYSSRSLKQFISKLKEAGIVLNDEGDEKAVFRLESGQDGMMVYCPDHEKSKLISAASETGLRIEERGDDKYALALCPISQVSREPRPFKNFIHYCRVLGIEIEGMKSDQAHIPLVGTEASPWPLLQGVRARLATDGERAAWSNKRKITATGSQKAGLWSHDIFGNTGNRADANWTRNATAVIELQIPVDLPLFRSVLEGLLDVEGFLLNDIEDAVRRVISAAVKHIPNAEVDEIWRTAKRNLSPLQTMDSLLDWLESLDNGSGRLSRSELSSLLESALPKGKTFNLKDALNHRSPRYQNIRNLCRHFQLMDTAALEKIAADPEHGRPHTKRRKTADALLENGYQPARFFMKKLLVLPKMLRYEKDRIFHPRNMQPRVERDLPYENHFNIFYRRILYQNLKIEKMKERNALEPMIIAEEERLRDLIYGLMINGKMKSVLPRPFRLPFAKERHYRSIYTAIAGASSNKEGIFRKHLLGKRVDFSSRAVIVPDPTLELDEVGLPFEAGIELFRDLLIHRVLKIGPKTNLEALAFIRDTANRDTIKKMLVELSVKHPVLLNRAPSLHRLSMLAFHPRFREKARVFGLNPAVCAPFNADFDGDTMGMFLPLLPDSIRDAAGMFPSEALRSPGHGGLVIGHKGDFALAARLMDKEEKDHIRMKEILELSEGPDEMDAESLLHALDRLHRRAPEKLKSAVSAFNPLVQRTLNRSGFSLSVSDFILDEKIRESVLEQEKDLLENSMAGETEDDVRSWEKTIETVRKTLDARFGKLPALSPLKVMLESKAAKVQLMQLSGIRGFMLRPGGNRVPYPVASNIVDGMPPLDYFISCHGSRHGLADKGLLTGPAGDLTNILVQAAQGESIVENDCKTEKGLYLSAFDDAGAGPIKLGDRVIGRCLAEDIHVNGEMIARGTTITAEQAAAINDSRLEWIKVRSPITCQGLDREFSSWRRFVAEAKGAFLQAPVLGVDVSQDSPLTEKDLERLARLGIRRVEIKKPEDHETQQLDVPDVRGVCAKCYGLDLGSGAPPARGFPVGIIAAQSIGEPGTQLTLRTFHTGGVAGQEISLGLQTARRAFSTGRVKERVKSPITGEAKVLKSPNGMYWLEIESPDSDQEHRRQWLPVVELDPVAGWNMEMEDHLAELGIGAILEIPSSDGSLELQFGQSGPRCRIVSKPETYPVTAGQRVFRPKSDPKAQEVDIKTVSRKYGPMAAVEYLLHTLQRIYHANAVVMDHHFEVILRCMSNPLRIEGARDASPFGDTGISVNAYLELDSAQAPVAVPQTLLQTASNAKGFLARLAFRNVGKNLLRAALHKESDPLQGFKERVITGLIRTK